MTKNKNELSLAVLNIIKECIEESSAPNVVEELIYERLETESNAELAEAIASAAMMLASTLVKDVGEYL